MRRMAVILNTWDFEKTLRFRSCLPLPLRGLRGMGGHPENYGAVLLSPDWIHLGGGSIKSSGGVGKQ
ncbi:hypothetical protein CDAR_286291 [Caerostris darwini]|uniref:Uncharacterized protein n=1 Tax=Caerostris darwini TaxID=1538125 RepID=A0AAV4W322_9ARAC|nr:hypothetical protein CDAR_286291 [Caerostris darwini]